MCSALLYCWWEIALELKSYQPPAVPLESGKHHPNPLLVPHTLGDFKKSGGHPQFPRQETFS